MESNQIEVNHYNKSYHSGMSKSISANRGCPTWIYGAALKFSFKASREDTPFSTYFWNVFNRIQQPLPRTTNSVEGWHFRMNDFLSGSHPSLWKCIEMLKKEELH